MNKNQSVGIIDELKSFLKELKSYDRLLRRNKAPSENQKRYMESLRGRLVLKSGTFRDLVTGLTGKQYYTQFGTPHNCWSDGLMRNGYPPNILTALGFCIDAITEAIGKLESDIKNGLRDSQGRRVPDIPLVDRTEKLEHADNEANNIFDRMKFHPKIIEASESLFKDGHYAPAILEAFKAVNNFVKQKTDKSHDGKALMSEVFSEKNPCIKLNDLKTQSDVDEQEGFKFLYMGAMVGIRNPKAHDLVQQKDPYNTLEYLAFASLLIKKIDFWQAE
ncbi:MAG: TIGR02391 family protein [Chloroflexi bacterium]|nr:TIGR02391 family protein [Chloroflexota bacterium]